VTMSLKIIVVGAKTDHGSKLIGSGNAGVAG
jgi:hypothetical protein